VRTLPSACEPVAILTIVCHKAGFAARLNFGLPWRRPADILASG